MGGFLSSKWSGIIYFVLGLLCVASTAVPAVAQPCGPQWLVGDGTLGFYGTPSDSLVWDPDGDGPRPDLLVFGGLIGARPYSGENLLVYDGVEIYPLFGSLNGEVRALGVIDGQLVAAGAFTNAGGIPASRIARWTGQFWQPFGSGMNGTVHAICVHDGRLYAAGDFTTASDQPANRVAMWNGTAWSSVGLGFSGPVQALASFNGSLYAAGVFDSSGPPTFAPMSRIARWNGTAWQAVRGGVNRPVNALAVHEGRLMIGGEFTVADGVNRVALVAWTGSVYESVGGTHPNLAIVHDFLSVGSDLHVAGSGEMFTFNQAGWTMYPRMFGNQGVRPRTLSMFRGELAAGGLAFGSDPRSMGIWNGTAWRSVGPGFDGRIADLVRFGTEIVAVGDFTRAGTVVAHGAAAWNGREWRHLSTFPGQRFIAVAADGQQLYAIRVTDNPYQVDVVRYSDNQWIRLGGIFTGGEVRAIAVYQNRPVVGGTFTAIGGVPRNRIVAWDSTEWRNLAGGVNGPVNSLTVFGDELIVGGEFSSPGGNVARWNGTAWSTYSNGLDSEPLGDQVLDTHVHNGTLYACGTFVRAGFYFPPINNGIARLVNGAWEPVGQGIQRTNGFASYAGELLAYGEFNVTSPVQLRSIARWDGAAWQPFAPEPDGNSLFVSLINDMLEYNGELLIGGSFFGWGPGVPSHRFLRRAPTLSPVLATQPAPLQQTRQSGEDVVISATLTPGITDVPSNQLSFQWFRNGLLVGNGPRGASGSQGPGGFVAEANGVLTTRRRLLFTIDNARPADSGVYHVVISNQCGSATSLPVTVVVLPSQACDYDFNQDENVDLMDAQLMAQVFVGLLTPESHWLDGDLDGDENADLMDAQILASFVVRGVCPI